MSAAENLYETDVTHEVIHIYELDPEPPPVLPPPKPNIPVTDGSTDPPKPKSMHGFKPKNRHEKIEHSRYFHRCPTRYTIDVSAVLLGDFTRVSYGGGTQLDPSPDILLDESG
ncbi:unnamed protein product [Didymodactylos carnosus]|uniref:Uncharacterized protein n=1 Tax=Didymodactylos carnosus TaxID=1234261 RepID=A0A815D0U4_9BILA|nr:unnamed protein product [Didymodactylos carnosus]CAF4097314.1 unnamed protein product [Didymodactylos carnosus]